MDDGCYGGRTGRICYLGLCLLLIVLVLINLHRLCLSFCLFLSIAVLHCPDAHSVF